MIDFTLRELECFHAVAEELNFTRAAERLYLSQPPLSRHIRELERRLGAKLFDRDKRRVALTTAGEHFRAGTRGVLEQLTHAQQQVRDQAAGAASRLEIAFVGALLSDTLINTLRAYQERAPDVRMTLRDSTPSDQLEALASGRIDIGFIGPSPKEFPRGVDITTWQKEPLHVLVPEGHEWGDQSSVSFADLEGRSLVTVSAEAAPAFNLWLQDLFLQAGIKPLFVQRADRARAVCSMTAVSRIPALLIHSACHPIDDGKALPVTDKNGDPILLTLVIAYRPDVKEHVEALLMNNS